MIFPEYEYQITNTTYNPTEDYDYLSPFEAAPLPLPATAPPTTTMAPAPAPFGTFPEEQSPIQQQQSQQLNEQLPQPFYFPPTAFAVVPPTNVTVRSPGTSSPYGVVTNNESEAEFSVTSAANVNSSIPTTTSTTTTTTSSSSSFDSTFGNIMNEEYAYEPCAKKKKAAYMPPLRGSSGTYTTPESLLNGVSREALRSVSSSELEECEKYLQSTYELNQGQVETLHKQIKLAKNREAVRKSRVKVQNKLSNFEMENIELRKKIMMMEAEIQKLKTQNAVLATENNALKRKHI